MFVLAEALLTAWKASVRPGTGISRRPAIRPATPWRRAGSHRFPGDPSHASALFQDPGRTNRTSPWRSCRCCPRATQAEGFSLSIISRLTQGFSIRCLRFTTSVAAARARLASGWRAAPLPGGGRTLWIAAKGFRSHHRPPSQDFACRKGGLRQASVRWSRGGAGLRDRQRDAAGCGRAQAEVSELKLGEDMLVEFHFRTASLTVALEAKGLVERDPMYCGKGEQHR